MFGIYLNTLQKKFCPLDICTTGYTTLYLGPLYLGYYTAACCATVPMNSTRIHEVYVQKTKRGDNGGNPCGYSSYLAQYAE